MSSKGRSLLSPAGISEPFYFSRLASRPPLAVPSLVLAPAGNGRQTCGFAFCLRDALRHRNVEMSLVVCEADPNPDAFHRDQIELWGDSLPRFTFGQDRVDEAFSSFVELGFAESGSDRGVIGIGGAPALVRTPGTTVVLSEGLPSSRWSRDARLVAPVADLVLHARLSEVARNLARKLAPLVAKSPSR